MLEQIWHARDGHPKCPRVVAPHDGHCLHFLNVQGVVAPHDGHCLHFLNVQGVVAPRDGHCLRLYLQ